MTTVGDRVLNISLPKIGEKSLFTKDLEDALKNGLVDFVVHSLKDLPTQLPEGMSIGAVLEREDPRDSLVLAHQHEGKCLKSLPEGSIIGRKFNNTAKICPSINYDCAKNLIDITKLYLSPTPILLNIHTKRYNVKLQEHHHFGV